MRHCVPTLFLDNNFSAWPSKDNSLCRSWPYPILQGNFLLSGKRAPTAERRTRRVLSLLTNLLVTFHWGWGWRRVSDRKLKRKLRASNSFKQLPATTRASVGHASPRFVRRRFSRDCFANRCKCRGVVAVVRAEIARTLTKAASFEALLLDIFYGVAVWEYKFGKLMIALLERFPLKAFRSRIWKIQGWEIFVRLLCENCYVRKPTNCVDHSFNCEIQ